MRKEVARALGKNAISIQFNLMAVNSDGKSSWQQSGPSDPINPAYPGSWDPVNWGNQTRTLTWDISKYDATGATWMQFVFSTNMGNVTTAGNYYIDNVKLSTGPAKKIVFVSFAGADNTPSAGAAGVGFTVAPDKGYTDLLEAQGFSVTRYVQTATPDPNVLNKADLVIVSRSVHDEHSGFARCRSERQFRGSQFQATELGWRHECQRHVR